MTTATKTSPKTAAQTASRKTPAPKQVEATPRPSKASTAKSGSTKAHASLRATKPGNATKSAPSVTAKPAKTNPSKPVLKKPSGLDLAAKVLAESDQPLSAKEIAERVIAAGWITTGKTPHATLYSAMLREIKGKGEKSRFVLAERGRFAARTSAGGPEAVI